MRLCTALGLLLLAGRLAVADTPTAAPLPPAQCTEGVQGPVCYHLFGGQTVQFALAADIVEARALRIQVQLSQLTRRLSAPRGPLMTLCDGDCVNHGKITLALPAVKRESEWQVQIRYRRKTGDWQAANSIAFWLYPQQLLAPLKAWALKNDLLVKDREGQLRAFLQSADIRIVEHTTSPAHGVLQLMVLRSHAQEPAKQASSINHILLTEQVKTVPKLIVYDAGQTRRVVVEMRLLDRLHSDPLTQKLFMEIFQTAIDRGDEVTT